MSIFKRTKINNKTKLTIYKIFGGKLKFKLYFNGVGDAGTCLLFKLRSGTHGLNEQRSWVDIDVEKECKCTYV